MRNNLRNISLYIISMTANLSSLCAALCSNWDIRKRLTDYSELTFFTSNSNDLLKNKINCVSLFQITLYEDFWCISGFQDCMKIQSDLNKLSEWCERNSLILNVDKCKTITFSRTRYPVYIL
jgi:hypothetical protein